MNIQGEWRDTIINRRLTAFIKMLAVAVGLILLYSLYKGNLSENNASENDAGYTKRASTFYDFTMGTSVSLSFYGKDSYAEKYSSDIIEKLNHIDTGIMSWRDKESEVFCLNNGYKPGEKWVVSDELYGILAQSLAVCRDSDGALDITIRPLADVWNIEGADSESFEVPDSRDIDLALQNTGYEVIDIGDNTITINKPDILLDFGAVGKGYALDVARSYIKDKDLDGAVISVGGSVLVYGSKGDGTDWHIGVRNPKGDQGDMIGYIIVKDQADVCISTSGDYEKYFLVDGIRYHHILDRTTGYPADSGLASVTVVCENGLYSDALSTACFVLGYEKSLDLLEKYNAEAVFIDHDNNIKVTEGLKDVFIEN